MRDSKLHALLFAGLALAVLTPYLHTGYYYDDAPLSLLPATLRLQGLSFAAYLARSYRTWIFESARLFPLGLTLTFGTWYLIRDLALYRGLQVAFIVADIFIFMGLIRAMGGGRRLALVSGLCVLGLFQIRNYHDPMTSYAFMMQASLALGAGATWLYLLYLDGRRVWALAASLALYAAGLLLYETGLVFLPLLLYVGLAQFRPIRYRWAVLGSHLGVTALYLGAWRVCGFCIL